MYLENVSPWIPLITLGVFTIFWMIVAFNDRLAGLRDWVPLVILILSFLIFFSSLENVKEHPLAEIIASLGFSFSIMCIAVFSFFLRVIPSGFIRLNTPTIEVILERVAIWTTAFQKTITVVEMKEIPYEVGDDYLTQKRLAKLRGFLYGAPGPHRIVLFVYEPDGDTLRLRIHVSEMSNELKHYLRTHNSKKMWIQRIEGKLQLVKEPQPIAETEEAVIA